MDEKGKIQLENGATIFYCNIPGKNYVYGELEIGSGSAVEPYNKRGLAHVVEHMTFHGSRHYPSRRIQEETAERLGIDKLNAGTNFAHISFPFYVPKDNTLPVVNLLQDLVFRPIFRKADLETEKKIIANECRREYDSIANQRQALFNQVFFRGTPLDELVIGREDHISSLSKEDVAGYHKKNFTAPNLTVFLFGGMDEDLISQVRSQLQNLPNSPKPEKFKCSLPVLLGSDRIEKYAPGARQCYADIIFRAPDQSSEDMPAMTVIANILQCDGKSGLMPRIRDKLNLAYNIFANYYSNTDYGYLRTGFDCGPEDLEQTLGESGALLSNLNPRQAEIEKAKFRILEYYKRAQDDPESRFRIFIGESRQGFSNNDFLEKVKAVSKEQVERAVKIYLLENPRQVVILGPERRS